MITDLEITNFAIIEKQTISFNSGMIVISGETGAGKSIILHALELILGGKANPKYIRNGAEGYEVQAVFDISKLKNRETLPDFVIGDELIVSRSLNLAGKSKIYINGKLVTLNVLSDVTNSIVNICKQGQSVKLTNAKYHLELLDLFSDNETLLSDYQNQYRKWVSLKKELDELKERISKNAIRQIELQSIVETFEKINFRSGLRSELENTIKIQANSEKSIEEISQALDLINSENGIYTQVMALNSLINDLKKLGIEIDDISVFKDEINFLENKLQKIASSMRVDPKELEEARDLLSQIASLERRYKTNEDGLVQLYDQAKSELTESLDPFIVEQKNKDLEKELLLLEKLAEKLSKTRFLSAQKFTKQVQEELSELSMPNVVLEVEFKKSDFTQFGIDQVQFLISTNKGSQLLPLDKIASGGELSRIMLVLKKILRDQTNVNVLIFDEIDTGISGKVARAVGEKLYALAKDSQVICITHLAQVASLADQHLLVSKVEKDSTVSEIIELSGEEKIQEIARMLSGKEVTKASIASAKELLAV